jgi:hypothetical protein
LPAGAESDRAAIEAAVQRAVDFWIEPP